MSETQTQAQAPAEQGAPAEGKRKRGGGKRARRVSGYEMAARTVPREFTTDVILGLMEDFTRYTPDSAFAVRRGLSDKRAVASLPVGGGSGPRYDLLRRNLALLLRGSDGPPAVLAAIVNTYGVVASAASREAVNHIRDLCRLNRLAEHPMARPCAVLYAVDNCGREFALRKWWSGAELFSNEKGSEIEDARLSPANPVSSLVHEAMMHTLGSPGDLGL